LGYVGVNYVPTKWNEQAVEIVSQIKGRKRINFDKETPRTIFPEWMGEEIPSVQRAIREGRVRWDEEQGRIIRERVVPDEERLHDFDFGTYYDDLDRIGEQRLGPDYVSVIERDPIKVGIEYLDNQSKRLRYWASVKTMSDNGLGYWSETVGGALNLETIAAHIRKLGDEIGYQRTRGPLAVPKVSLLALQAILSPIL